MGGLWNAEVCFQQSSSHPIVHSDAFLHTGEQAFRLSDDSTLVDVVSSPGERVAVRVYESWSEQG